HPRNARWKRDNGPRWERVPSRWGVSAGDRPIGRGRANRRRQLSLPFAARVPTRGRRRLAEFSCLLRRFPLRAVPERDVADEWLLGPRRRDARAIRSALEARRARGSVRRSETRSGGASLFPAGSGLDVGEGAFEAEPLVAELGDVVEAHVVEAGDEQGAERRLPRVVDEAALLEIAVGAAGEHDESVLDRVSIALAELVPVDDERVVPERAVAVGRRLQEVVQVGVQR